MRLQDRQIARIAFFANRPLTAKVYTRMSAAGPQHVTAVFAQYGDMDYENCLAANQMSTCEEERRIMNANKRALSSMEKRLSR